MADIHPNDIGLATYEDVGDVEKLKTAAKVVVDAINEICKKDQLEHATTITFSPTQTKRKPSTISWVTFY